MKQSHICVNEFQKERDNKAGELWNDQEFSKIHDRYHNTEKFRDFSEGQITTQTDNTPRYITFKLLIKKKMLKVAIREKTTEIKLRFTTDIKNHQE